MRNTQKILYQIGKIVSWVLLGIYALTFVINLIFLIVNAVNENALWVFNLSSMTTMLVMIALALVLIFLVKKYEEDALKAPTHELKPLIFLMVFGLLSGNWLYLVGGVFGIIGASQEAKKSESKEEEKKD